MKKTLSYRIGGPLLAVLLIGGLSACGDDSESEEAEEPTVTAEQAITEIEAVRTGIDDALATYEEGDAAAASETVSETYLQHFELVEVPLEEADPELNEELEHQIREDLVAELESEAPTEDVEKLAGQIDAGLDDAEKALEGA